MTFYWISLFEFLKLAFWNSLSISFEQIHILRPLPFTNVSHSFKQLYILQEKPFNNVSQYLWQMEKS